MSGPRLRGPEQRLINVGKQIIRDGREKSEAWLEAVLNNMVDGVVTIDADGLILTLNPAAEKIFGLEKGEIIGENVSVLAAEPYSSAHDGYINRYLKTGKARIIGLGREVEGRRKDGSIFPMGLAVSQVQFGDQIFFVGIIRDISERKAAEDEIKSANKSLAGQAVRLADANEALADYAYAVSHDLKAPLRAIHNYSDFLKEDLQASLGEEQLSYLNGLATAACEAEQLVDDLLHHSEVGTTSLVLEEVDMGSLLEDTVASLKFGDDVTVDLGREWPIIISSATLLKQIFRNLISNGAKFNDSKTRRVELGWRTNDDGACEISVGDNGIGIEPQYFKQVFQIFQRLHTKSEYDGTGVGLAIVKKAVKRLGGTIELESRPGKGTTFTITLPPFVLEQAHD